VAERRLRPAFETPASAAGFATLVGGLILLPVCLAGLGRPRRAEVYDEVPLAAGIYRCFKKEIVEESGDIDLLFLGASYVWAAIDTPFMQDSLSRALGRPSSVLTLAANWRGEELDYVVLRDLLARRRVGMLVVSMPQWPSPLVEPHPMSPYLVGLRDDPAVRARPLAAEVQAFALAVLGAPRHLLSALRPEAVRPAPDCARGAGLFEQGFEGQPFRRLEVRPPTIEPESLILSEQTRDRFQFTHEALNEQQAHFTRLLLDLAREHQVPVVFLNIPLFGEGMLERHQVREFEDWPALLEPGAQLIGIPAAELFAGAAGDEAIRSYYYNTHLNRNGAELFTRTIAGALIEAHRRATKKHDG
jgi:hypothetical protein